MKEININGTIYQNPLLVFALEVEAGTEFDDFKKILYPLLLPEDVANACVFFGSEMSAYVTGQVMNVDGGMLT